MDFTRPSSFTISPAALRYFIAPTNPNCDCVMCYGTKERKFYLKRNSKTKDVVPHAEHTPIQDPLESTITTYNRDSTLDWDDEQDVKMETFDMDYDPSYNDKPKSAIINNGQAGMNNSNGANVGNFELAQSNFNLLAAVERLNKKVASVKYPCNICNKKFVNVDKHLANIHKKIPIIVKTPWEPETPKPQTTKCFICSKQVTTTELVEHEVEHYTAQPSKFRYSCQLCAHSFPSIDILNEHIQAHNLENLIFTSTNAYVNKEILKDQTYSDCAIQNANNCFPNENNHLSNELESGATVTLPPYRMEYISPVNNIEGNSTDFQQIFNNAITNHFVREYQRSGKSNVLTEPRLPKDETIKMTEKENYEDAVCNANRPSVIIGAGSAKDMEKLDFEEAIGKVSPPTVIIKDTDDEYAIQIASSNTNNTIVKPLDLTQGTQLVEQPHKYKLNSQQLNCRICAKTFPSISSLVKHVRVHQFPDRTCEFCEMVYADESLLEVHLANDKVCQNKNMIAGLLINDVPLERDFQIALSAKKRV